MLPFEFSLFSRDESESGEWRVKTHSGQEEQKKLREAGGKKEDSSTKSIASPCHAFHSRALSHNLPASCPSQKPSRVSCKLLGQPTGGSCPLESARNKASCLVLPLLPPATPLASMPARGCTLSFFLFACPIRFVFVVVFRLAGCFLLLCSVEHCLLHL